MNWYSQMFRVMTIKISHAHTRAVTSITEIKKRKKKILYCPLGKLGLENRYIPPETSVKLSQHAMLNTTFRKRRKVELGEK